jgi:hypothetical protein
MENDGSEEQQSGEEADGPRLRASPGGVLRGEIAGDGECDQAKNKNPAEINVNGYAEYAGDANPLCLRHLFHRTANRAGGGASRNPVPVSIRETHEKHLEPGCWIEEELCTAPLKEGCPVRTNGEPVYK